MILCEDVVLSMGVRPELKLKAELDEVGIPYVVIGDAVHSGTIADAVHSAYDTAIKLS